MARREDYLLSKLLLTDGTVTFGQLSDVLMEWGEDSQRPLLDIVLEKKLISEEDGRWLMISVSKLCEQEEVASSLASLDTILCQLAIKQNLVSPEIVNAYQRKFAQLGITEAISSVLLRDGKIPADTFSNLHRIAERIFYRRKIWALVRGKERISIFHSPGQEVPPAPEVEATQKTALQRLVAEMKSVAIMKNVSKKKRGKALPKFFGDYEIIEEVASGGMGTVYKARHITSDNIVALKVLHDEEGNQEKVQRFLREAEVAKRLKHPNIVGIYDMGDVDGRHYFTMDYIEGVPLSILIKESKIELEDCLSIALELARAVCYAHEKNVIHRDMKPANIIIDMDGHPQITDFGLAKDLDATDRLTRSDTIIGTPFYMSPEQTQGAKIGPYTDIWGIGVILYEMVTKKLPFMGRSSMELYHKINNIEPVAPRKLDISIPKEVEYIILRCMEKDVIDRYQTADVLGEDIERFLEHKPISMKRCPKWLRPIRKFYREYKILIFIIPLVIILGSIVAFLMCNFGSK